MINNETVFNAKRLIEESDPAFKEFFTRFLQLDEKDEQSNSQMFKQFLTITQEDNQDEADLEEGIMIDHFRSAIDMA